jgi:CHAT domain-containing protein
VGNGFNKKEIRTAVLFGRPVYKTGITSTMRVTEGKTRSLIRNFRDNNIPDLPGTEEEVLAIKKEMNLSKMDVTIFLKEQATEDKVYQLKSPGILHIATHGYWSSAGDNATDGYRTFNAMANSGLLLSGVVNYYSSLVYPDTYDGVLTAYEAQNLDLENTSLVILSACETSLGYLDAGEGVYGLQRAFRAAGAGSIMTSLWKVDDAATRDFMIIFYQHFLRTKEINASFISAQKAMKAKYKHPCFWGAFVLAGN